VKKIILGIIILKTVLFILRHNLFVLLSINGHDTNTIAAEIDLRLTKDKEMVKCTVLKTVSPEAAAWFASDIAPYTHSPPPPVPGADSSGPFSPIRIILRLHLTVYYSNLCN
jgi:hypothetical protein